MASRSNILTVSILTDASKAGVGLSSASAQYGKFAAALGTKSKSAGVAVGNSLVNGIDKAVGVGLKVVGAAGGLVLATALVKGWQRLDAIDQATAKLRGLGNSASDVAKIMKNANAAVKGTAFGLGEAAGVAATAVASGIQPGKQLESVLKTVADSATIAGTSLNDMGAIFGKVAAKNKLQGDVINQLQSQQVPILQYLAKHYNTTAEAASEMVSRGEVDFANFAAAMKENVGGAALESGNTFQGAWNNTLAALGRIGANLLSPIFTGAKNGLKGLPALLEPIEKWATSAGQALADMGKWAQRNAGLLKALGVAAAIAVGILLTFRAVVAVMSAYRAVLAVVKALQIGYAAATYGSAAASYAGAAATVAQNIALVAGKAAFLAVRAAQAVATAAQWAFNAAVSANPIALIIIVIVALVAAFILLWNNCEGFRNFWIGLWAGIQAVVAAVVNWLVSAWQATVSWLSSAWQAYIGVWASIWSTAKAVVNAVVSFFRSSWQAVVSWFGSVWAAQVAVFAAIWGGVRATVSAVVSFFKSAWQGAVSTVTSVLRTLQSVFTSVFHAIMVPINAVIGAFQTVIGWIQQVISLLGKIKIPDVLGSIGKLFGAQSMTVTAAAGPAPFAASRFGAFATPFSVRAAPSVAVPTGGGGNITIVVEGGLDSSDTIARRIRQILGDQSRRAGGVSIQRRAT